MRLLLISCILLAACDDHPIIPLSAGWLEWPVAVAPGTPFDVRLVGYTDVAIDHVRVRVRTDGDTVTIEPYGIGQNCPDLCRSVYNTVVQVPGIGAPTARTIWLRATHRGQSLQAPWPLRTFGSVVVAQAAPMDFDRRAAGIASGLQNSFGCYQISPFLDGSGSGRRFVSFDQPPDWAPGFTGFVYGRIHSTLESNCGAFMAPVMVVDSIR